MKTSRFVLLAALLSGTAALLSAGPGPQYWNRPAAAKAPAPVPAPVSCAACACCGK